MKVENIPTLMRELLELSTDYGVPVDKLRAVQDKYDNLQIKLDYIRTEQVRDSDALSQISGVMVERNICSLLREKA